MKWLKSNILLVFIILLAGILRLWSINAVPPSLTWDEVAWGYNAYTIGIDGKDEFGKFLPLGYLESFGDFKPTLYVYLTILPVKILGLNEFATRLPSAFFGTLSIIVTYHLVLEIFGRNKRSLALISSGLLAISPWHIMLSRAAFEANVAQFFVALGILLFLKAVHSKSYLLIASSLSFTAAMYTFNSARIVVPILVVVLAAINYKKLLINWRVCLIALFVGFIVSIPLLLFLNTPQSKLRFQEVNIFAESEPVLRANQQIQNDNNSAFSKIIHNRRLSYGVEYIRHYIDNLTPQFLFIKGDGNPKFSIQDVGQLYMWEVPFFIAGILMLFRKREKFWWIIPLILLVGIIPAGFARETPHALRIENSLPSFQVITAIGILAVLSVIPKKLQKIGSGILMGIIIFNFAYFIHNYATHYSREFSGEWQYGYKEAIAFSQEQKNNYKKIYITETLGRPYIYYLFYTKHDPVLFRNDSDIYREALGFVHVTRYSSYYFTDKITQIKDKDALYIATPSEKPDDATTIREFKLLDGQTSLVAYRL